MEKYLLIIDDFMFDKVFERLCHWSQKNIGKGHHFWTKLSWALLLIFTVLDINYRILMGKTYTFSMLYFVLVAFTFLRLDKMFKKAEGSEKVMNSMRMTDFRFRIFFGVFYFSSVIRFLLARNIDNGLNVTTMSMLVCILYFSACTDLPKSKTRNKVVGLFQLKKTIRA